MTKVFIAIWWACIPFIFLKAKHALIALFWVAACVVIVALLTSGMHELMMLGANAQLDAGIRYINVYLC